MGTSWSHNIVKGVTESSEDEEDSQAIEWEAGHEASGSSKSILKNKEAKAAPATTGLSLMSH